MQITGKDLIRSLKTLRCSVVAIKGSHQKVQCGTCVTTVAVHAGRSLPIGTLRQTEADLAPCLGEGWLNK
jgi:predicted RNA binding protein YcfA (HicA-like mRNA interferase family)